MFDIKKVQDNIDADATKPDVEEQGESYSPENGTFESEIEDGSLESMSDKGMDDNKKKVVVAAAILAVILFGAIVVIGSGALRKNSNVVDENGEEVEVNDLEDYIIDPATETLPGVGDSAVTESAAEPEVSVFDVYTEDEVKTLRAAGYTGDEIESFAEQGIRATTKITEAKEQQKEFMAENLADVFDGKSEAYKELEAYTWVGQDELVFDANHKDEWQDRITTTNVDYVKVPLNGYQCWLRIDINGAYAFMMVKPERYAELPESGNIVVTCKYIFTGDTTVIYDIQEKDINS